MSDHSPPLLSDEDVIAILREGGAPFSRFLPPESTRQT